MFFISYVFFSLDFIHKKNKKRNNKKFLENEKNTEKQNKNKNKKTRPRFQITWTLFYSRRHTSDSSFPLLFNLVLIVILLTCEFDELELVCKEEEFEFELVDELVDDKDEAGDILVALLTLDGETMPTLAAFLLN